MRESVVCFVRAEVRAEVCKNVRECRSVQECKSENVSVRECDCMQEEQQRLPKTRKLANGLMVRAQQTF